MMSTDEDDNDDDATSVNCFVGAMMLMTITTFII